MKPYNQLGPIEPNQNGIPAGGTVVASKVVSSQILSSQAYIPPAHEERSEDTDQSSDLNGETEHWPPTIVPLNDDDVASKRSQSGSVAKVGQVSNTSEPAAESTPVPISTSKIVHKGSQPEVSSFATYSAPYYVESEPQALSKLVATSYPGQVIAPIYTTNRPQVDAYYAHQPTYVVTRGPHHSHYSQNTAYISSSAPVRRLPPPQSNWIPIDNAVEYKCARPKTVVTNRAIARKGQRIVKAKECAFCENKRLDLAEEREPRSTQGFCHNGVLDAIHRWLTAS